MPDILENAAPKRRMAARPRRALAALAAALALPWFAACPPAGPVLIPPAPVPAEEEPAPTPEAGRPAEPSRTATEPAAGEPEPRSPEPADFESLRLLDVPGIAAWTDAGFDVDEGQRLSILAEGAVSLQKGNPTAVCGPDGYGLKTVQQPLPELNIGALIGKVVLLLGVSIDPQTGKEIRDEAVRIFPVGSRAEVTIPLRGRLYLGVNELVVGDNEGAYRVKLYLLR
jgi:hypothetical protein